MGSIDTAGKVGCSLLLKLPLNFYWIVANWLIDSSFFPRCEAHMGSVNRCPHTGVVVFDVTLHAEWLEGCWVAKQQSTVNALAGVSTANLLSRICTDVAIWTTVGSAVTRAACKFNVGCVVSVLIKLVKLSARFQPFPCWIWSHLTHLLHSLCTNYAVNPAPGPVLSRFSPGTRQKGVFPRCWVTSQFNYSSGIVLSGKYLTTPLWQRHDICILMSIFREKVQVDVFSEGYTCLWTQAGFLGFFFLDEVMLNRQHSQCV